MFHCVSSFRIQAHLALLFLKPAFRKLGSENILTPAVITDLGEFSFPLLLILCLLFYNLALILINRTLIHTAANAGKRINAAVSSDDGTGI